MPFYPGIKKLKPQVRSRTIERLLELRAQLQREVSEKTSTETLLLATWNIRDFDSNKFGHGKRLAESLYYIAEIISAFDLVALQEINKDLKRFEELMGILGGKWDYIATDETDGASGNQERMVFVYDTSKVRFKNIAGEIVLPQSRLIRYVSEEKSGEEKTDEAKEPEECKEKEPELQFARTPFMVAFQAGWFKFMLCTVHIYYGKESEKTKEFRRRVQEIQKIAKEIADKADDDPVRQYVLLGDFNIISPEHKTMQALTKAGFFIHPDLMKIPSNFKEDKHYDQIAFRKKKGELELGQGIEVGKEGQRKTAGVFNYYSSVFRPRDYSEYTDEVATAQAESNKIAGKEGEADSEKYYKNTWRTFQMSDHLPMWIELKIDFTDKYLKRIASGNK